MNLLEWMLGRGYTKQPKSRAARRESKVRLRHNRRTRNIYRLSPKKKKAERRRQKFARRLNRGAA